MAAVDLADASLYEQLEDVSHPVLVTLTLSGTANNLRKVYFPKNVGQMRVSVRAVTTAAYYCVKGADEVAVGTASQAPLDANTWMQLGSFRWNNQPGDDNRPYLLFGSTTNSQELRLELAWK